jgi:hypothetical protein
MHLLRRASVLLSLALPLSASAAVLPLDEQGRIFGIENGVYEAQGTLVTEGNWTPNLKLHSVRRLEKGVIDVVTKAYLVGFEIGSASARLQVNPTGPSTFQLLDLNLQSALAGTGECNETGCTFTATILNGALTLTETWIAVANGFDLRDGKQSMKGRPGTYEASFLRK